MRALTQAAAKEYASRVSPSGTYCPGVVGTDMWVTLDERFSQLTGAPKGRRIGNSSTGSRWAGPDSGDVVAFVSYLAGPDSDYMTGHSRLIDGVLVYR